MTDTLRIGAQTDFSELKIDAGGDDQLSSFHSESSQQDFPNKTDFTENIEIYFRDFVKIHHDAKALVKLGSIMDRPRTPLLNRIKG